MDDDTNTKWILYERIYSHPLKRTIKSNGYIRNNKDDIMKVFKQCLNKYWHDTYYCYEMKNKYAGLDDFMALNGTKEEFEHDDKFHSVKVYITKVFE